MAVITVGSNPQFGMSTLDFTGVPCGIDIRRVGESGVCPVINTGIAHRRAGVGQVGAGIARAPIDCFVRALEGFVEKFFA